MLGKGEIVFAKMAREEKVATLAEIFREEADEFAAMVQMWPAMVSALRAARLPEDQIFAQLVVTASESLKLDLDDNDSAVAALLLGWYQVKSAAAN